MESKEDKPLSTTNDDASSHIDLEEDHSPLPSPSHTQDAKPTSSPARPRSPAESSGTSDLSLPSPPSHRSSPVEEKRPDSSLLTAPVKHPSPVRSLEESSVSSELSHPSSPICGPSPVEEKRRALNALTKPPSPPEASGQLVVNRSVWDEPAVLTKVEPRAGCGSSGGTVEEGGGGGGGFHGSGRRGRPSLSILKRVEREKMVKRAALGFRICAAVFCLISFSVMAADTKRGWAVDSFYRYKELRYCITVNVIGFLYSVLQAYDTARYIYTGKYLFRHRLRHYLGFSLDQVLTYLLMSASSSAATRVDDWQANWGKDKFPEMASASLAMSFLAFVSLASSSLISGYTVCTSRSS